MKKHYCPSESHASPAPGDARGECLEGEADLDFERAAALMGHDAVIAQAEGELAAVLRRKVSRRS